MQNKYLRYNARYGTICDYPSVSISILKFLFFGCLKSLGRKILPAESTFISLVGSYDTLPLPSDEDYLLLLSFLFKASCLVCRKCNMNCWWYIHRNCLRRSILDVVLCWEMIRYFSLNLVLGNIPFSVFVLEMLLFLVFCFPSILLYH